MDTSRGSLIDFWVENSTNFTCLLHNPLINILAMIAAKIPIAAKTKGLPRILPR